MKYKLFFYDFDDNAPLTAGDDKMTMIGINIARPFQM
jgi:hypothetical protein